MLRHPAMRPLCTLLACVALTLAAWLSSTGSARAAGGNLDPAFGSAGIAYPWGTGSAGSLSRANASVMQPDGKLVVVGIATNPVTFGRGFSIVRLNADGTLDTTFGNGGRTYISFTGGSDVASSVRLLPNGSIMIAGSTDVGTCCSEVALARLTSSGAPDPTFGSGGTLRTTQSSGAGVRMVLTSTGQAVVLVDGGFSPSVLLRFTLNGAADPTFGSAGVVTVAFSSSKDNGEATSLVLAANDGITVAGYASPALDGNHFALARYTSTGALDTAFGAGGTVIRDMGYKDGSSTAISRINDLASGPDGTLNAFGELYWQGALTPCCGTGRVPHNGEGAVLGRFTSSGTYITQTVVGGAYSVPGNSTEQSSSGSVIAAAADGGLFGLYTATPTQLVRFMPSGAVDSTFGNAGHVDANFGADAKGNPVNVAVQADGRPVVVGDGQQSSKAPVGEVGRFLASLTPDPAPRLTGLSPSTVTAGQPVTATATGAPGSALELLVRKAPSTSYIAIRTSTVPGTGTVRFTGLTPSTNSLYAVRTKGSGTRSSSLSETVRSAVSLSARKDKTLSWSFSGSAYPYRRGAVVTLYQVTSKGLVKLGPAHEDGTGHWRVNHVFGSRGTRSFVAVTPATSINAAGRSVQRRYAIR